MTEEEFAAAVAVRASALGARGWCVRACGPRVEIEAGGQRHVFHPVASFRASAAAPAADLVADTALRIVALVAESPGLQRRLLDWDWAGPRLRLRLVAEVHEVAGAAPALRRPWLPGVALGCAVLDARTRRLVQVSVALSARWGVGEGAVWEAAGRNMGPAQPPRRCGGAGGIFALSEPDAGTGQAAQVLAPHQMERAAEACGSEDLLVGLPDPGTALLCAAAAPEAARLRRAVALLHAGSDAPLLGDPLRWQGGRWSRPCPLVGP